MSEHPIEGLMTTAMNSIQDMIDVNTIIGDPIETSNNVIIIPISKVSFGFAAGGSEFRGETIDEYSRRDKEEDIQYRLPFGGGSGAGVSINPIAFLVVQPEGVRLLPVKYSYTIDKLLDYVPEIIEKTNDMVMDVLKETKDPMEKKQNNNQKSEKDVNERKVRSSEENKATRRTRRSKNLHPVEKEEQTPPYTPEPPEVEPFDFDTYPDDYDD